MIVSPSNPVRDQAYEAQCDFHDISLKPRALRTQLAKHTNGGQFYK
jgi:transposase